MAILSMMGKNNMKYIYIYIFKLKNQWYIYSYTYKLVIISNEKFQILL